MRKSGLLVIIAMYVFFVSVLSGAEKLKADVLQTLTIADAVYAQHFTLNGFHYITQTRPLADKFTIHKYDSQWKLIKEKIITSGKGPGEITILSSFFSQDSNITMYDSSQKRINYFSENLEYIDSLNLNMEGIVVGGSAKVMESYKNEYYFTQLPMGSGAPVAVYSATNGKKVREFGNTIRLSSDNIANSVIKHGIDELYRNGEYFYLFNRNSKSCDMYYREQFVGSISIEKDMKRLGYTWVQTAPKLGEMPNNKEKKMRKGEVHSVIPCINPLDGALTFIVSDNYNKKIVFLVYDSLGNHVKTYETDDIHKIAGDYSRIKWDAANLVMVQNDTKLYFFTLSK